MNILIYGPFAFPNGTGATARMHAYGSGLISQGCAINLFCVEPTEFESSIQNKDIVGEVNGIHYRYTCGTTVANSSSLRRKLDQARGVICLFFGIIQEHRKNKIDIIIYYTAKSIIHAFVGWLACKICKITFYAETTEFPLIYEKENFKKILKTKIHNITCKLYDGLIVISTLLETHYRKLLRESAEILRIPIIVDTRMFVSSTMSNSQRTICYCGNLSSLSELDNLLYIFSRIICNHENVILKIIGDLEKSPYKTRILDIVMANNLQKMVIFTGAIAHKDIASVFAVVDIFVLPRPSGLFSSAGFPTKLGEYLAIGKPVITTDTGDIPLYLTHKVDAYLVEADNNEAFAATLNHVLSNPDEASIVGKNGRQTCLRYFDAEVNAVLMLAHFRKKNHCNGVGV